MGADQAAELEMNRLRARLRELESQRTGTDENEFESRRSPRRFRRGSSDDPRDIARDLPVRLLDETNKFVRALTFAYLEQVRLAADVLDEFTEEVFKRNRPLSETGSEDAPRRRTITDLTTSLPGDFYAGFVRALDRSLDIPSRSVERFHEAYRQTERDAEPTLREHRRERAAGRSAISDEPAEVRQEERKTAHPSGRRSAEKETASSEPPKA